MYQLYKLEPISYFTFDPLATEEPVSRSVLVVAYPIDIPLHMELAIRGFSNNLFPVLL